MKVDDLEGPPGSAGIGALLMTGPGLPRDARGRPYQPLFWFDADSRTLGMVLDEEGHVLAWDNDTTHVDDPDAWRGQRVPEPIERAALEWWRGVEAELTDDGR